MLAAVTLPTELSPELIPPLEAGDRLTRTEFERRYAAHPNLKKAELIEGLVYMAAAVRFTPHGEPHLYLNTWLGLYLAATPGLRGGDNATLRLDVHNEPQPDLLAFSPQGPARIDADGYVVGAPEFIAEIAASSASYDLGSKLKVYRRHQVQEYLVWQVFDRRFTWFRWRKGQYRALKPDPQGILRSEIFPGLWLDCPALLAGNLAQVLTTLQLGLATPEHHQWVDRLRSI